VKIDGNPWFVAADVCRALDLPIEKGATRYLQRLAGDEKRTLETFEGRGAAPWIITESGL
jgi:prophage antirepressor-like protein